MYKQNIRKWVAMVAAAGLTGCSAMQSGGEDRFHNQTTAVATEYSKALICLGELVNQSNAPPLNVYVNDIDDETVPRRFRDRRLSKGGAWWFHTAIAKMQSSKVVTLLDRPGKTFRAAENFIELGGAWTQDDEEISVDRKNIGFNNLGTGILDRFGFSSREEISVIAGDFVSTRNNQVVHASAISLAIKDYDSNFELRIDDGSRRFDLGLSHDVNEGPQFAQRRIVEAAALVHIADAFDVDYSLCLTDGTGQALAGTG